MCVFLVSVYSFRAQILGSDCIYLALGFTGMLCEIKLDLCLHSKYCITDHASACVDRGNEVTCQCASGWTGDNCGVNINECIDHKCQNGGHCIDKVNGYECKCKKKFFGLYCESTHFSLIWKSSFRLRCCNTSDFEKWDIMNLTALSKPFMFHSKFLMFHSISW